MYNKTYIFILWFEKIAGVKKIKNILSAQTIWRLLMDVTE